MREVKMGADDFYTIAEFCASHRITRTTYYQWRREGKVPTEIKVGSKILIPKEAIDPWRAKYTVARQED